jgi:hypothetical protein
MVEKVTKITPRQLKALESLITYGSIARAAAEAGVSRKTVHAWLRQPAFADELRRLEGLALQSLGRRLMALGELATAALFDALQPGEPMSNRLRAAAIVTERGPALSEITAILARIEQLERRQDEK